MLIPLLLIIIFACLFIGLVMAISSAKKGKKKDVSGRIQKKGKAAIIKEAQKKLAHNPHDVTALRELGNIYFSEKNWEKAYAAYKTLLDLSSSNVEINGVEAGLKTGIAAYNLGKIDDALSVLILAVKKNPESYEANLYLGKALYQKEIFDKAIACLKKAKLLRPESGEANQLLGFSLFKLQKYRECLPFLKAALDETPDNKEILYNMAVAMMECGMGEKSLKVFIHLRPDPLFGPQSCLEAGKMHEKVKDFTSAIQDYEIALKLPSVPDTILIQIKYRAALTYIAMNNIPQALTMLKQVQAIKANYKDVEALIARYSELNQNKNLQVYMMAGTSEFIALCRKFISSYYPDAFVKVGDQNVGTDCVDIVCEIEHPKWSAKQLFRFYRSQSTLSDLAVRECHGKMRDDKCDKAICVTLGSFSESAHKFIDGRPIDLIEKEALSKMLLKISII
ncbi:Restriction endonuclease [Treponema sp. JC4]|uniref:tetratricopeptide repeat protein n=1 Tax=Treponema sp. JC4 TaxID=1124982 RepID=UPI00025AFBA5|nr:tetratricopeptide repeat protein [Treponema sp. JC4]EID85638.1 Restriction endonuclease [Treponema sp. JC4]